MVNALSSIKDDGTIQKAVEAAANSQVGWVQFSLSGEQFQKVGEGAKAESTEAAFADAAKQLKSACYILVQDGSEKWVCVTFLPSSLAFADRCLYSASAATLKHSLGPSNKLLGDMWVQDASECTYAAYTTLPRSPAHLASETKKMRETTQLMTAHPAVAVCELTASTEVAAAVAAYKEQSITTMVLGVGEKGDSLDLVFSGSMAFEDVNTNYLQSEDPRFVLHRVADDHGGPARDAFLLVSPDTAPGALKVRFACCKTGVLSYLLSQGLSLPFTLEVTEVAVLSLRLLLEEMRPKVAPEPLGLKKPKRKGRGKARLAGKPKFVGK